jgi:hypothetical protein
LWQLMIKMFQRYLLESLVEELYCTSKEFKRKQPNKNENTFSCIYYKHSPQHMTSAILRQQQYKIKCEYIWNCKRVGKIISYTRTCQKY